MNIGFIGAGKVGFSLGKYLRSQGLDVAGYYSRNPMSAKEAAEFTGTNAFDTTKQIVEVSDVLFFTVPDGQIASVWEKVRENSIAGKIMVHCSGALTSAVFSEQERFHVSCYSIHPLLAVSDKYRSWQSFRDALFTIEGSSRCMDKMRGLFSSCGNEILEIKPEQKMLYHAAASVSTNFVVTLADVAQQMLMRCGFTQQQAGKALGSMMLGNMQSVLEKGPEDALTGPIERCDTGTVAGHIGTLLPDEKALYQALARRTLALAKRKHPERNYTQMEDLLK